MNTRKYMVREGKVFGRQRLRSGALVELTPFEAEPFLDLLRPVSDAELAAMDAHNAVLAIADAPAALGVSVAEKTGVEDDPAPKPAFSRLPGEIVDLLVGYGFTTETHVAAATDEELLKVKGIGPSALSRIRSLIPYTG